MFRQGGGRCLWWKFWREKVRLSQLSATRENKFGVVSRSLTVYGFAGIYCLEPSIGRQFELLDEVAAGCYSRPGVAQDS